MSYAKGITHGKKVQIACRLDRNVFNHIKKKSQENDMPFAEYVRFLISEGMKND